MPVKVPTRDPAAAHGRKARAARRVGVGARCSECREARPQALITGSRPVICFACERKEQGKVTEDDHHVAGVANDSTTLPTPVNDHRAVLSPAQYDWPKETRENPDGSPLLAGAAKVRGFVDYIEYLIEKFLLPIAKMLEDLDRFLVDKLGRRWWPGTTIEQYAPTQKSRRKKPSRKKCYPCNSRRNPRLSSRKKRRT